MSNDASPKNYNVSLIIFELRNIYTGTKNISEMFYRVSLLYMIGPI